MSGFKVDRRQALALGLGGAAMVALPGWARAAELDETGVDAIVQAFMAAFETPGIGVAIVRRNQPDFLKGYGVRAMDRPGAVDAHTRFGIASNSKAFTAAALAILIEEGRLGWDDPVVKHLPEFRMYDPAVTQMMTVRDLLVHRSGLPLGAGDLMYFPQSTHVAADVLTALPYLKPARGFRAGYDYDNILYLVAGLVIERISGMGWGAFVRARILEPVGMADAVTTRGALTGPNVAARHARLGPPVRGIGPMTVIQPDESPMTDAAAGINCSVTDIAKWLRIQLAGGRLPGGDSLWGPGQAQEMWTPQTIVSASDGPTADNPIRAVTNTYALGWFVADYRGRQMVSHSGGLSGQVTQTAMIPSLGIGVAVFSNTEDGVSGGIRNALLDALTGAPAFDWVGAYVRRRRSAEEAAMQSAAGEGGPPPGGPSLPLTAYAGRYRDPWYGDIVVSVKRGKLWIVFEPTAPFQSVLDPWGPDTFRTRFAKEAGEDAVVTFNVADGTVTGVRMKALSPLADFSYDYHHLDFVPVR